MALITATELKNLAEEWSSGTNMVVPSGAMPKISPAETKVISTSEDAKVVAGKGVVAGVGSLMAGGTQEGEVSSLVLN